MKGRNKFGEVLPTVRVLLVDDEVLFCDMLVPRLESRGFSVVAVAHSAAQAEQLVGEHEFDLAIVDIELDKHDAQGFNVVRSIQHNRPEARIAIFSYHLEASGVDLVRRAKALDVDGIILKKGRVEDVCRALRKIAEDPGVFYLDPTLKMAPRSNALEQLTPAERSFLRDYARQPLEPRAWAQEHGKPERFYHNRMNPIKRKIIDLDLRPMGDARTQLTNLEVYRWAFEHGLHFE